MIRKLLCKTLLFLFHNFTLGCVLPYRVLIWNWTDGAQSSYSSSTKENLNKNQQIFKDGFCLEECLKNKIIPKLSNFWVPKNGCFNNSSVRVFQRNLLRKEVHACVDKQAKLDDAVDKTGKDLKCSTPEKLPPSIWHQVSSTTKKLIEQLKAKHKREIENLSALQDSLLLNTEGYLRVLDDIKVPECKKFCLRYGPKHPILTKFKEEQFLALFDELLADCAQPNILIEITNKINATTFSYISSCKLKKSPRILDRTKKWLKDNDIMAVPYDKGTGFCIMQRTSYFQKLVKILNGPQFKAINVDSDFTIKQETKFCKQLSDLMKLGDISKEFNQKVRPVGSQPGRLYGLAKVHKKVSLFVLSCPCLAHNTKSIRKTWLRPSRSFLKPA